jgi:drug/metabolite transporter (DMT)-like permease
VIARDSRSRGGAAVAHAGRMSATSPHRTRAIVLLTVATLVWGLSFPVMKTLGQLQELLVPGSGNWLVTVCTVAPRFLVAGVALALVGAWRHGRPTRLELRQGLGLALFLGLGLLLQVDGLQHTHASVSAFLTQLYAVLIPLWVAVRTRRLPRWPVWAACALVIAGVGVLGRVDVRAFRLGRGELETILGSLFFTAQILWLERKEFAGNRVLPTTAVMFLVLGVAFGAASLVMAPEPMALLALARSPAWLGLTAVLTAACTIFCFVVMNACQPRITATEAGLIYTLEPVSASALALFLPAVFSGWTGIAYANELFTWHLFVGGVLLTAANVLVQLPVGRGGPATD